MPKRKKGESLKDYVSRCIPIRQREHPEESQDRSVAACYGMGRKGGKKKQQKKKKGLLE
jgi:hypothetical protein